MIVAYTGKPGSGKSYLVVHDIFKKEIYEQYYVFHNIDGVKNDAFPEGANLKDWRTLVDGVFVNDEKELFSEETQKKLTEEVRTKYNKKILWIIDEAQRYFDKADKDYKAWLSFHRHFGQTIWVVCQNMVQIHKDYKALIDLEIVAKSGYLIQIPKVFIYGKISAGQGCGYRFAIKKQKVFEAYQSFIVPQAKSRPSFLIPIIILFFIFAVWYFLKPMEIGANNKDQVSPKVKTERNEFNQTRQAATNNNTIKNVTFSDPLLNLSYKGQAGGKVIVENMQSGRQFFLHVIAPYLLVMKTNSYECCVLYDTRSNQNFTLVNKNIYEVRDGDHSKPERTE